MEESRSGRVASRGKNHLNTLWIRPPSSAWGQARKRLQVATRPAGWKVLQDTRRVQRKRSGPGGTREGWSDIGCQGRGF
ncbi:hypothetical protein CC1G_13979 [Coprinopsis cinerea okayama7|uniref:Uncharacterized protein n=1 Tax=Coprinopsis cinerea (strain Okayama-7 / 130 / ATCC MYA-4618 / FGSC 9003) TaxID=240176 RepID=D6RKR8_COPC7|nr:hypothetical protein CC1G_13979 [Coprinopsis cinerea okayama7\|eukprot:XP_002911940.1 hypothetical protein CC1G_13979 [Coprinopsis cinerea okayama7\